LTRQRFGSPRQGNLEPTLKEICEGHPMLRFVDFGIKGIEPYSMLELQGGSLVLTQPGADPAAYSPSFGKIGVYGNCLIHNRICSFGVLH
jgi:hypothetical protein